MSWQPGAADTRSDDDTGRRQPHTHIDQRPFGTIHAALIEEFSRAGSYVGFDTRG